MGYETKMYVAVIHDTFRKYDDYLAWAQIIGMFDLCKAGYDTETGKLISRQTTKEPVVFFYGDDGNTQITHDRYGDALGVISIPDMIAAMKADNEVDEYRRFTIAIAFLEAVSKCFDLSETFIVTFGY